MKAMEKEDLADEHNVTIHEIMFSKAQTELLRVQERRSQREFRRRLFITVLRLYGDSEGEGIVRGRG